MVATVTDEQFAARALVRDWARNPTSGPGGTAAIRDVEQGDADAWRPVFAGLADLGLFGVAIPEDRGGAGGSIEDLCAMVEEAAKALVPGPIATTALATVVLTEVRLPELLAALAAGERFAGLALEGLEGEVQFDGGASRASGTLPWVLGAAEGGVLILPAGGKSLLVDTRSEGVRIEPLAATDFSRPLARVVLTSAPATVVADSEQRVEELAATVLAAEAAGVTRWCAGHRGRLRQGARAVRQADRQLPGRQAPVRGDAVPRRAGRGRRRRRRARPQRTPIRTSSPSRRPWPRASASPPRRPTSRTASRCSAASAAPGSTTRTCTCAGRMPSAGSSAAPSAGCAASRR